MAGCVLGARLYVRRGCEKIGVGVAFGEPVVAEAVVSLEEGVVYDGDEGV